MILPRRMTADAKSEAGTGEVPYVDLVDTLARLKSCSVKGNCTKVLGFSSWLMDWDSGFWRGTGTGTL